MATRRHRKQPQEPEFGSWRVPVDKPAEAEHIFNPSMRLRRRLKGRIANLMAAPRSIQHRTVTQEQYAEEMQLDLPGGWERAWRVALAVCVLLPLSVVMVYALVMQLYRAAPALGEWGFWMSDPVWFSSMGALAFVAITIMKLLEPLMMYTYVLGHELTHAIAIFMSFGTVKDFKIDAEGGYVETESDNMFIALSPYFVPFWMLVWMGVLWLVNFIAPFEGYEAWFYAGFGFWWSFHVYWTLWIMPREQPDMLEKGALLSALVILLMNIGILLVILRLFNVITFSGYARDLLACAQSVWDLFRDLAAALMSLAA